MFIMSSFPWLGSEVDVQTFFLFFFQIDSCSVDVVRRQRGRNQGTQDEVSDP